MKIENIQELQKVIAICRKQGVVSIKVDNLELILGDLPAKQTYSKRSSPPTLSPGGITEDTKILTDELTEEQLLMWSATGENQ